MKRLFQLDKILYGKTVIALGIEHKKPGETGYFSLKEGKVKLSENTPHKKHSGIYTPIEVLDVGKVYTYRETLSQNNYALIQELEVLEISAYHVLCNVITEKKQPKQRKTTQRKFVTPEHLLQTPVFFPDWMLADNEDLSFEEERRREEETRKREKAELEAFIFFNYIGYPKMKKDIIRHKGKRFERQTDFFFVYAPKEKRKTGSKYKKITPDSRDNLERTFEYNGIVYDEVSGKEQGLYFTKPCPRYKEIQQ